MEILEFKKGERFVLSPKWDNDLCLLSWRLERQELIEVGIFKKSSKWVTYTEEESCPDGNYFTPQVWFFNTKKEALKMVEEKRKEFAKYMAAIAENELHNMVLVITKNSRESVSTVC